MYYSKSPFFVVKNKIDSLHEVVLFLPIDNQDPFIFVPTVQWCLVLKHPKGSLGMLKRRGMLLSGSEPVVVSVLIAVEGKAIVIVLLWERHQQTLLIALLLARYPWIGIAMDLDSSIWVQSLVLIVVVIDKSFISQQTVHEIFLWPILSWITESRRSTAEAEFVDMIPNNQLVNDGIVIREHWNVESFHHIGLEIVPAKTRIILH